MYLLRVLGGSQVWLEGLELTKFGLGIRVRHCRRDDYVLTLAPVDRSNHTLGVGQLQGVKHSQHFGRVSTGGGWICHDQSNLFTWINDEHRSDSGHHLVLELVEVVLTNHIVLECNLLRRVGDDRETERISSCDIFNIFDPSVVALYALSGQTEKSGVSLLKLWSKLGKGTQLSGANWGEVSRMREQDNPLLSLLKKVMESNFALGGVGGEIGGSGAYSDSRLVCWIERRVQLHSGDAQ